MSCEVAVKYEVSVNTVSYVVAVNRVFLQGPCSKVLNGF